MKSVKKLTVLLAALLWAGPVFAHDYYTGTGGKGTSLTVLAPEGKNLAAGDNYLPDLVQSVISGDFTKYSAMSVTDWQALSTVLSETEKAVYAEGSGGVIEAGKITQTQYILNGSLMNLGGDNFSLQLKITDTTSGANKASYAGNCTAAELTGMTGIRKASADLLTQMGVALTAKAQGELLATARQQEVQAQAAIAKGTEALRKGTVVEALSYFIQSANYDPSLTEAASRVNITSSNISSGNIGADARNAIAWRKAWVARLAECDKFVTDYVKNTPLPTYLLYSTDLTQGKIDWAKETLPISFDIGLSPNQNWLAPITGVVEAVYTGLMRTGQAGTWKLDWPATNLAAASVKFDVAVQLLNDQGAVIGTQTVPLSASWKIGFSNGKANAAGSQTSVTVTFPAVDANKITDKLTIKVVSLDGTNAETASKTKNVSILTVGDFAKMKTGKAYKTGDTGPAGGIMLCSVLGIVLEVAPASITFMGGGWKDAVSWCASLKVGGIGGWRLPTKDELDMMYRELKKKGLGGFSDISYWSSTEASERAAWEQSFFSGHQNDRTKAAPLTAARAVRDF